MSALLLFSKAAMEPGAGGAYVGKEAWTAFNFAPLHGPWVDQGINKSFSVAKVSPPLVALENLDLCTETLGCETGVFYTVGDYNRDLLCCAAATGGETAAREDTRAAERTNMKSARSGREFPPPLTVLSGEPRLRIVSAREQGRLHLYLCVKRCFIIAERGDGRLKLRLQGTKQREEGAGMGEIGKDGILCNDDGGGGGCLRRNTNEYKGLAAAIGRGCSLGCHLLKAPLSPLHYPLLE